MDPNDDIELSNLSKGLLLKLATQIDVNVMIEMNSEMTPKSFIKLYYKQQETIAVIGIPDGN